MWHRFKILCVQQNVSINKKVIELVRKEVETADRKK